MKPFNKAEALKGAPVVLRNGAKAVVGFEIPVDQLINSDIKDALHGYIVGPLNIAENTLSWKEDGRVWSNSENELDIVGMWEEPTPSVTVKIPKPLFEKPKEGVVYVFNSAIFAIEGPSDSLFLKEAIENGLAFAKKEDAISFLKAIRHARA